MGRPICFRCLTPILLSQNVLQLAHQYEENCYETEKEARMTCFDSTLVTISDGALLFRTSDEQAASCSPMDGRFDVSYRMNDAALSCESGEGTTIVIEETNVRKLYFANDSSCSSLSMKTAFDSYYFHSGTIAKPFAPCSFPIWMQGEFDSMKVSSNELQYLQHHVGAVPLISHCVKTFEDRVMVFSETKWFVVSIKTNRELFTFSGEPLGYHCLLFNARSQNLIEFKTSVPTDKSNTSICTNSTQWDNIPWFSSVVLNTSPYPCGIVGTFSTPKTLDQDYCYDLIFNCNEPSKMDILAYHCNDGIIFDSKSYTCLASWKHDDRLLIYTNRENEEQECFVTHFQDGKLFVAATGDQCERNIDFAKNQENVSKAYNEIKKTNNKTSRIARVGSESNNHNNVSEGNDNTRTLSSFG
uniref:Uncharacterized protein n=1 Tax=Caenorhabditis tropicalis TaxID=1561998 RepID=A0A1I7TIQ8_9PELO